MAPRPGLLVSVRSVDEALTALEGGVDIIDVKEPSRGPLGRADDAVIAAVIERVAGRRPVSAALGELRDEPSCLPPGLTFVKCGLAGWRNRPWQCGLSQLLREGAINSSRPQLVIAGYADWQCAQAPPLAEVVAFAQQRRGNLLLIDTFDKGTRNKRRTLLDWLSAAAAVEICHACRAAGVRVALAGSLGPVEIQELCEARPDWFAVRGAACRQGRESVVCPEKIHRLSEVIQSAASRKPAPKRDVAG